MIAFAALLERLAFSPSRDAQVALLRRHFATVPDPERGFGLAALAGTLRLNAIRPALIRALAAARTDPVLFDWSHDYVGDLSETVALVWPGNPAASAAPRLAEVVETLNAAPQPALPDIVAAWLDRCDAAARLALLRLITRGIKPGIPASLARTALAALGRVDATEVEEVWHAVAPPYQPLFAWLEGRGPRPDPAGAPVFRAPMRGHKIEAAALAAFDPAAYRAEWKWDGLRVQLVATARGRRLYARDAEDISAAFPEIVAAMDFRAVLDGELLVMHPAPGGHAVAPFGELQQRLNRKTAGAQLTQRYPVGVRLYDILFDAEEDLRPLSFDARRARLEAWYARTRPARMDISELIPFATLDDLAALRRDARAASAGGIMLKRRDSPYVAGRPRGLWWKWKRDPHSVDAVLMYAERGHGKRGGFYRDYTFGLWRPDAGGAEELVPVGKSDLGFTDAERAFLERWVRAHTIARFGPVSEVEKALVLEIVFDEVQRSARHKSGVTLRAPRIARLRQDKPAAEADRLERLLDLMENPAQLPPAG